MALKPLAAPLRHQVGDLELVVPAASRTLRGTAVTLYAQRCQTPVYSAELSITDAAARSGLAGKLATNGEAQDITNALLELSFAVENELRAKEASKPEPKEKAVQGRALDIEDPEPWPEAVDVGTVLSQVCDLLNRYLVLPVGGAVVMALWVVHTYLVDAFEHTAYLAITSPVKRSGKTTTLTVAKALVWRPVSADNVTTSALFRKVEKDAPTLLIDELDRLLPESDVWGVLNSGHSRDGSVLRTVGDDHEPRAFATYCAKLLSYIRPVKSPVPDTVEDRSIRIQLQRRGRHEIRERLRTRILRAEAEPLQRKLARWAEDHREMLAEARPILPDELDDRAADCWEPLLAIADLAGGDWPAQARSIAIRLSVDRAEEETDAPGILVITDLGELLAKGKLHPDDLGLAGETMAKSLREEDDLWKHEERPWRTWGRKGDGLTETSLARLLKPFSIRTEMMGPTDRRRKRYRESALQAAVERFSPVRVEPTLTPSHGPESGLVGDSPVTPVRVCGLDPHTEGASTEETLTPTKATTRNPNVYIFDGAAYLAGDTLPDGRVLLEVDDGLPILTRRPKEVGVGAS